MPVSYMGQDFDMVWKMVLIGDSGVGKTNFLTRYAFNTFTESSATTIGVDFATKDVTVKDKRIKVQIWDTAGQEKFRAVTHMYYRGAKAIMLLYDITSHESYEDITKRWLPEIENEYRKLEEIPPVIMLIGHKLDLRHIRTVTEEQGQELASKHDMMFSEASSQDASNVEFSFTWLLNEVGKRYQDERDGSLSDTGDISFKLDEAPISTITKEGKSRKGKSKKKQALKACCNT